MAALTRDTLADRRGHAATAEAITARRREAETDLGIRIPVSNEQIRRYRAEGKVEPTA